jgi:hypothetical protein
MPTVQVADDDVLLTKEYVHELAKRLVELRRSRQGTANWLTDILFREDTFVLDADGNPMDLHDEIVEQAYGRDGSFSWNSAVKRFAQRLPKKKPKPSVLPRLRLFDAAFKLIGQPIIVK